MIRPADALDAAAISRLHCASILAGSVASYTIVELVQWAVGHDDDFYRRLVARAEVVVYEHDGDVVAFGVSSTDIGLVNAVYVDPAMVGRGIGKGLVRALEGSAIARGATEARLDVTLGSVGFYTALGYRDVGPSRVRFAFGAELPCVAMVKRLRRDDDRAHPSTAHRGHISRS